MIMLLVNRIGYSKPPSHPMCGGAQKKQKHVVNTETRPVPCPMYILLGPFGSFDAGMGQEHVLSCAPVVVCGELGLFMSRVVKG